MKHKKVKVPIFTQLMRLTSEAMINAGFERGVAHRQHCHPIISFAFPSFHTLELSKQELSLNCFCQQMYCFVQFQSVEDKMTYGRL